MPRGGINETKRFLGKVLGEVYRLQRRLAPSLPSVDGAVVYGLLHGFEHVIEDELDRIGWISSETVEAARLILERLRDGKQQMTLDEVIAAFEQSAISRHEAIRLLAYFAEYTDGGLVDFVNALDSAEVATERALVRT